MTGSCKARQDSWLSGFLALNWRLEESLTAPTYHRVKEGDAYGQDVRLHIGDNKAEDDVTALVTWPARGSDFEQRGHLQVDEAVSLAQQFADAQSLDITVALDSERDQLWDQSWGVLKSGARR